MNPRRSTGTGRRFGYGDNAHSTDEHHEHEYTSSQGKRDPTVHPFNSVNQAMAAAMTQAAEDWPAILENWRSG
jgi:hypothetical protein